MRDPAHAERRAIVSIPKLYLTELLTSGLGLPPGYKAIDIREDFATQSVRVLVTGPDVPMVDPACYPPELTLLIADGHLLVRRWKPYIEPPTHKIDF